MKNYILLVVGITLLAAGCAKEEAPAPQPEPEAEAVDPLAAGMPEGRDATFLDHMHAHAEMLDDVNYALADGDLEGAMTPAYWLSRHDTVTGIDPEWHQYVDGMRAAARDLEGATDLEPARAAAERINKQCQDCHAAAGME